MRICNTLNMNSYLLEDIKIDILVPFRSASLILGKRRFGYEVFRSDLSRG
jgi:hypothetical protein